jgi:hypothetical protein
MRNIHIVFALAALVSTQSVFADDQAMSSSTSKPCATIAKACLDAGFVRTETSNKKFWQDCMKPIILGHTVQGVTVDASTVKACRSDKISELKKELTALENAS